MSTINRRVDTVECYVCGGNGENPHRPARSCDACCGHGRLDLDAVRKLVDDEARDHDDTKHSLLRKIEECDALRVQRRSGWVRVADRLPDTLREVLVWADDSFIADDGSGLCVEGWTALAWYIDGRGWWDASTGKAWAHKEPITMWHEIAARPNEDQQAAARRDR